MGLYPTGLHSLSTFSVIFRNFLFVRIAEVDFDRLFWDWITSAIQEIIKWMLHTALVCTFTVCGCKDESRLEWYCDTMLESRYVCGSAHRSSIGMASEMIS